LETDLIDVVEALLNNTDPPALSWSPMAAVCVVLAAQGYPDSPRNGDVIHGLNKVTEAHVFQAGTKRDLKGMIRTSGGRVLSLVGTGDTIPAAKDQAYAAADVVEFAGKQFRQDIAS
jgi:phosphoribosylamine--glycine ligase